MLFGRSLFQSVLERLKEERQAETPEETAAYRIHGFSTGFVAAPVELGAAAARRFEQSYIDILESLEPPPLAPDEPPAMPPHLARLALAEIAEDLALSPDDTVHRLNEKRRAFAKLNHPDGVNEPFRHNATIRMTIANLMIDEALGRLA